jgi:formylglycine-generating enzyme
MTANIARGGGALLAGIARAIAPGSPALLALTVGLDAACGSRTALLADVGNDAPIARPAPRGGSALNGGSGTATGQSCAHEGSGLTNCGASSESCCASLEVAGGSYYRTYTNGGMGAAELADPATITSFRLDKYLVTVGRFRGFVTAWNVGYRPAAGSGKHAHLNAGRGLNASAGGYEPGWVAGDDANVAPTSANLACGTGSALDFATFTDTAGDQEDLPINCVNWYESYAFCIWDGGFLPSEAEWEYAAAGGSQQREYPWGSIDPGMGNEYAIYGYYTGFNMSGIAPVGTAALGAGYWGQLDLAGELFEWNLDWYATYADPCLDCTAARTTIGRVIRGGYFQFGGPSLLLPPDRIFGGSLPSDREAAAGFRCARAP